MHFENGEAWGPCWLQNIADTIEVKRTKGDRFFQFLLGAFTVAIVGAVALKGVHWFANHPIAIEQSPLIAAAGFAIIGLMAFVFALYRNQPALESY